VDWEIEVGQVLLRREVHRMVGGGNRQSGIATVRGSDEILVFTNPRSGSEHGYDAYEGLREDGSYGYTGEGQQGDQQFTRGNKALLETPSSGRNIRLFRTAGVLATYIGAFTLDDPPFSIRRIPDFSGVLRDGIVFNLIPIDAAALDVLPVQGRSRDGVAIRSWKAPSYDDYVIQLREATSGERAASRIEFQLQSDFGTWLERRGDVVRVLDLDAGGAVIQPDLYNETTGEVIEAKKSVARGYIRTAIGQVLDYANVARRSGLQVAPSVLLPGEPPTDLLELCLSLGITVWTRSRDGFNRFAP
jgi:hypothetical protein